MLNDKDAFLAEIATKKENVEKDLRSFQEKQMILKTKLAEMDKLYDPVKDEITSLEISIKELDERRRVLKILTEFQELEEKISSNADSEPKSKLWGEIINRFKTLTDFAASIPKSSKNFDKFQLLNEKVKSKHVGALRMKLENDLKAKLKAMEWPKTDGAQLSAHKLNDFSEVFAIFLRFQVRFDLPSLRRIFYLFVTIFILIIIIEKCFGYGKVR